MKWYQYLLCPLMFCFKGRVSWYFFHESSSPQPLKVKLESFKFFWKIRKLCTPPVSTTPVGNLPLVSATPVANLQLVSTKTAVNFPTGTTGVVDTDGQFAEVGGPQIANPQICGLTKFVTFGLLQMWQFADLRFANSIFLRFFCGLKTLQIRKCSNSNFY